MISLFPLGLGFRKLASMGAQTGVALDNKKYFDHSSGGSSLPSYRPEKIERWVVWLQMIPTGIVGMDSMQVNLSDNKVDVLAELQ